MLVLNINSALWLFKVFMLQDPFANDDTKAKMVTSNIRTYRKISFFIFLLSSFYHN